MDTSDSEDVLGMKEMVKYLKDVEEYEKERIKEDRRVKTRHGGAGPTQLDGDGNNTKPPQVSTVEPLTRQRRLEYLGTNKDDIVLAKGL